jgi:hypothetical protein
MAHVRDNFNFLVGNINNPVPNFRHERAITATSQKICVPVLTLLEGRIWLSSWSRQLHASPDTQPISLETRPPCPPSTASCPSSPTSEVCLTIGTLAVDTPTNDLVVDFFRNHPDAQPPLACFLSHVHSDHLAGLESLRSPLYVSAPRSP